MITDHEHIDARSSVFFTTPGPDQPLAETPTTPAESVLAVAEDYNELTPMQRRRLESDANAEKDTPRRINELDEPREATDETSSSSSSVRLGGVVTPTLDEAMFYGVLGDYCRAVAPYTEASPVGILCSALSAAGALLCSPVETPAVGNGYIFSRPTVRLGSQNHPLLNWFIFFGPSGSGRKGEATTVGQLPFHEMWTEDDQLRKITVKGGLSSGQGLIDRIRDSRDEKDEGGRKDKRVFIREGEFGSVINMMNMDSSILGQVLRDEAWTGDAMERMNRNTKQSSALKASWSHVSIVGNITGDEFTTTVRPSHLKGGTFNRFLTPWVERSKILPDNPEVPQDVVTSFAGRLRSSIQWGSDDLVVQLDQSSQLAWRKFYQEFEENQNDTLAGVMVRRVPIQAMRIAATFAILDRTTRIMPEHLEAAISLVLYCSDSAKYVMNNTTASGVDLAKLDKLKKAIDQSGFRGISRTDISVKVFSRNVSALDLDDMLGFLLDSGRYFCKLYGTGPSKTQVYFAKECPRTLRMSMAAPFAVSMLVV